MKQKTKQRCFLYFFLFILQSLFVFSNKVLKDCVSYNSKSNFLTILCVNKKNIDFLIKEVSLNKKTKEFQIKNIKLCYYASKFLTNINMFPGVKDVVIDCDEKDQVSWMNEKKVLFFFKYKYVSTKGIRKLELKEYSLEILQRLSLCKETKEIIIYCSSEDNLVWIKSNMKQKDFIITKIKLVDYASKIVETIKGMENLSIVCSNEDNIVWIDKEECKNEINLKSVKNVFLVDYAIELLRKLTMEEIKKLSVSYSNEECLKWTNVFERNEFIRKIKTEKMNQEICLSFIFHDKRKSLKFFLKKPNIDKRTKTISRQQTKFLSERQLKNLTKEQFSFLIENNIKFLTLKQFSFFNLEQINQITPSQIKLFDEKILNNLSRKQIKVISSKTISSIPFKVFSKLRIRNLFRIRRILLFDKKEDLIRIETQMYWYQRMALFFLSPVVNVFSFWT